MIIKIEDQGGSNRLWDNISEVNYQRAQLSIEPDTDLRVDVNSYNFCKLPVNRFSGKDVKGELAGEPDYCISVNPKTNDRNDVVIHDGWWITGIRPDGTFINIFFDSIGYLLNDSGKTVEVLR